MKKGLLALLAAALFFAACTATASAAEQTSPAAASWSNSRFDVFVRGGDGMIYSKWWQSDVSGPEQGWSRWGSLGAPPVGTATGPAVTSPREGVLQLIVLGKDNQVWYNHWTHGTGAAPGGWSGWNVVPNTGHATSLPAITHGPDGEPDIFYRGPGNSVWYVRWNWNHWTAPADLGDVTDAPPAVTTVTGGRIELAIRATDGTLHRNSSDAPPNWTGWGLVPGATSSMGPALSTDYAGRMNIFMRGASNAALYHQLLLSPTVWLGPSHVSSSVALVSTPAAARLHLFMRDAPGDIRTFYWDDAAGWQGPGNLGQPDSDGQLFREQNRPAVWYMEDGNRHWVTSPEAAAAAGLDLNAATLVPDGSMTSIPRGWDLTVSSLEVGGPEPDPGTATSAGTAWKPARKSSDPFSFYSADARAVADGEVKWFAGKFPYGFRHRGDFSLSSAVYPVGSVPCMWVRVRWGYPAASVSFPPGGSVSGAEEIGQYFVRCRRSGQTAPGPITLSGLGFSKGLLNSATLTICTSNSRAEGPRWCSNDKMTWGW